MRPMSDTREQGAKNGYMPIEALRERDPVMIPVSQIPNWILANAGYAGEILGYMSRNQQVLNNGLSSVVIDIYTMLRGDNSQLSQMSVGFNEGRKTAMQPRADHPHSPETLEAGWRLIKESFPERKESSKSGERR